MSQIRALHEGGLALGPGDVMSAVRAAVLAQGTRKGAPDWSVLRDAADYQAAEALKGWIVALNRSPS